VGVQGMSMGLALLLSRAGGNPDLVDAPSNGFLFDPSDTTGFASALRGWLTPAEVKDWFAKSDILFLPSLSEGLPVVGVQGMSMGLALLLSRAGGNPDLVEAPTNGYLYEPNDTAGYARALRRWLTDPAELLQTRLTSRKMADVFSLDNIVAKYEEVLTNASR
jgi:glycosyltransferase involved in cell wall biosynthesis